MPCFFNFLVSRARPEKLCDFFFIGCNFESRASQIGLRKQKNACDKTWTGMIKHGLKKRGVIKHGLKDPFMGAYTSASLLWTK